MSGERVPHWRVWRIRRVKESLSIEYEGNPDNPIPDVRECLPYRAGAGDGLRWRNRARLGWRC